MAALPSPSRARPARDALWEGGPGPRGGLGQAAPGPFRPRSVVPTTLPERRLCPAQCVPRLVVLCPPPACCAPQDPLPASWQDGGRVGRRLLCPGIHSALGLGHERFSGAEVLALRLQSLLFGESWGPLSGAATAEPPLVYLPAHRGRPTAVPTKERQISRLCTLLAKRPHRSRLCLPSGPPLPWVAEAREWPGICTSGARTPHPHTGTDS